MPRFTVQCSYAAYHVNTVTVEADTLAKALENAINTVNDDGKGWKPIDHDGDTFVDAAAKGAHHTPWDADQLPIPHRFTELGVLVGSHRPPPDTEERDKTIHVDVAQGVVTGAHLPGALADVRVIVRDFDVENESADDIAELPTDRYGARYRETNLTDPAGIVMSTIDGSPIPDNPSDPS